MAKRFIQSDIWDRDDFLELDIKHKLLQLYLICECDCVGLFDKSLALASFKLKFEVTEEMLMNTGLDVIKLDNGKFWLKKFCKIQYGVLKANTPSNRPHTAYIKRLKEARLLNQVETTMDNKKMTPEEIEELAIELTRNS